MASMEQRSKNLEPVASEEPRCVVHDVPDDLLRLILLRLNSQLWLVRAACVCKRWCRIVTDGADEGRAFLRLARSLHPPAVVGHYHNHNFGGGRFVPSSPTPIRLSLDFFPPELVHRQHTIDRWDVADCHGGLVLLLGGFGLALDLVVCDPLSRQYRDIHRPPNQCLPSGGYLPRVFLLDCSDGDGNISISNFRVLYCSACSSDYHDSLSKVYVFSTEDDGGWRLVRQSTAAFNNDLFQSYMGQVIGRINRSLYLATRAGSVKVLDNASRLEFSEVDLPIQVKKSSLYSLYKNHSSFAVVHGSAGPDFASPRTTTTACIIHVRGDELELFRRVRGSGKWMPEHSIPSLHAGCL